MTVTGVQSGLVRVKYRSWISLVLTLLAFSFLLYGCQSKSSQKFEGRSASGHKLELVFTYGSEKEKWISDVTEEFNGGVHETEGGKRILVQAIPMGSGEAIDEVLEGRRQPDLISPASAAFIELGNAESRSRFGKDLIAPTQNLVLSPVVIAMWKPMAEALGWGKKPIGWSDILALARDSRPWQEIGDPQWGRFKFGHTQPELSDSGLITLFAEMYAASGKTANLTTADVRKPHNAEFLFAVEKSTVHYGTSAGSFGRQMFSNGPKDLSAAVLYENMVVESYSQNPPYPIVAIYPREGTFWSDHPIGLVERDWVTAERREAAKIYIQYLLERRQQEKAMAYGFRPGVIDVPLASPVDLAHGVDSKEPETTLEVPSVPVMHAILTLWQQKKKSAQVVLVMDTSGSMNDDQKIQNAREAAKQFVKLLSGNDRLSLLPFSTKYEWAGQNILIQSGRDELSHAIDSFSAHGGTALYDSIDAAYQYLLAHSQQEDADCTLALVVLTDGEDTESSMHLSELMDRIRYDGETHRIHVFTIAYGKDARKDILANIAEATQAKFYEGTPDNIVGVFKQISTFF